MTARDEKADLEQTEDGQDRPAAETAPSEGQKPKREYRIVLFDNWCKRCGICVEFCRKKVYTQEFEMHPVPEFSERCVGCQSCVRRCPDFAIMVTEKRDDESQTEEDEP
ncbi:MAG: 4Fe-4S dicluster domain-containing protein [Planctomycetota bacterium]|nr:MAG: 4Fe-4S dicluster domain-containing protein [Planctomycetota bacterium]